MENAKLTINRFDSNDVICTSGGIGGSTPYYLTKSGDGTANNTLLGISVDSDDSNKYLASNYYFIYYNSSDSKWVGTDGASLLAGVTDTGFDSTIDDYHNYSYYKQVSTSDSDFVNNFSGVTGITAVFKKNQ